MSDTPIEYSWSARKIAPKIILYVLLIFLIFILISYFGFHSINAVKALLISGFGYLISLLITAYTRIEYKLTKDKLENRPINKKNPKPFKTLFRLDEIDHLKPINSGFKYYLTLNNKNFWNKHISYKYSGEIKLEKVDRERITSAFKNLSIKIIKS